jgi:tetratricopeptide (TPR) repeat protein
MIRHGFRLLILLGLITAALPDALGLPDPDDEWVALKSERFIALTNADPRKATKQLLQLEQFRSMLEQNTGGLRLDADLPTYVYIFRNEASMRDYKIAAARAYHVATRDGYYIALNIRPATGGPTRDNPYTLFPNKDVYHEYVHFALNSSFSNVPAWLHEGFAEYYSTFWSSGKKAEVGRPIVLYVKNLDRGGLLSQEALMTLRGVPHGPGISQLFYAQSWATVHYLLHGSEPRRQQFFDYFHQVTLGTPLSDAFSKTFDISFEQLEQEVRGYIHMRSLGYATVPAVQIDPDAVVVNTAMTRDVVCYRLGTLMLAGTGDAEGAEEHFREALRINEGFGPAHYGLGLVELRRQQIDAAVDRFQKATAGDSANPMEYLALGQALTEQSILREIAGDPAAPEILAAAVRAFDRSLELQPRLASAAIGLGRTRLLEPTYRAGLETQLQKFWKSRPTRMEIPVTTALMLLRDKKRTPALGTLRHAASLSPRPLLREAVREALALVALESWTLPPHARATEDCLRMIQSFRSGGHGKELQAKLTGDDDEIRSLSALLEAAASYLEALRLARGDQRESALETLRTLSEDDSPVADAARALFDGVGDPSESAE